MPSKTPDFKFPKNVRFECVRCALCCGDTHTKTRHIIMTESEAKKIREKTLHSFADFASRIEGHAPYAYEIRKKKGTCVFLDEASCAIYSYRPLVCRFYPFELKNKERGGYVFSYTNECPGIGRGKRLTRKDFQESLNEAKDRLYQVPAVRIPDPIE